MSCAYVSLASMALAVATIAGCVELPPPQAAATLECPAQQIRFESVGWTEVATGCGRQDVFLYDADQGRFVSLRERARFAFACQAGDIDIEVLDSASFGATGCGRRAVYKVMPMAGFVVDSTSTVSPESGPARAPGGA